MSEDPRPGPGRPAAGGASPPGSPPPAPAGDEMVGRILAGRYRIVRLLGEGAQSTVYVGEHQAIGRLDAIKVLRRELAGDREAVGRLTRGARNVSAIRHPNVCTVYDYSTTEDGLPFLAMELVEGESLKDILEREGRLAPERALSIAAQIADALEAAHDAGIVHRDLKPGNVMVARGRGGVDQVKVVDFDIAKATSEGEGEVTRLGFVVGTPEYMSPEQLMGEALDGRSDLYSLGLVLFRMLTGTLPFRTQVLQDLLIERLTQPPLTLADLAPQATFPPGLQALLDRALQRKADERIATAAEFAAELRRLAGASPQATMPTTVVRPAAEPHAVPPTRVAPAMARAPQGAAPATPKRRGVLIAVAAVLVLAVAGFAAWALVRSGAPAATTGPAGGAAPAAPQPPAAGAPAAGAGPP
ncbi:MAG: serine/threonine protein kinase, partial [Gemmatimonadetes bacterium]|nr:serine/threonine protein kinase [Gemmatimonadota bacterium]